MRASLLFGLCMLVGAALHAQLPLEDLLRSRDPAGLAALAREFEESSSKTDRQKIAVVLVNRTQDDQLYFDFLADAARSAIRSGIPFPLEIDSAGKVVPSRYSAEFLRWAAAEGVAPDAAARRALTDLPLDVFLLAMAGDPRAEEILLEGVASHNYAVASRAAWGLAKLQSKRAIRPILEAAKRAPGEAGEHIAKNLPLFDDPEAQALAERVIRDKRMLQAIRDNAQRELSLTIGEP